MIHSTVRAIIDEAGRPSARVHHIREQRVSAILANYPPEAVAVCSCQDCGLETRKAVTVLSREGHGNLTPDELAKRLVCERASCGGQVTVRIGAGE